jgi:hypothetical protein
MTIGVHLESGFAARQTSIMESTGEVNQSEGSLQTHVFSGDRRMRRAKLFGFNGFEWKPVGSEP